LIDRSVLCVADILVIGVGNYEEVPKLNKTIVKHLRDHNISVEVLATVSLFLLLLAHHLTQVALALLLFLACLVLIFCCHLLTC